MPKNRISIQDEVKLINGSIYIAVQDKRIQYQNRQLSLIRLASTLQELLKPSPKKKETPFLLFSVAMSV